MKKIWSKTKASWFYKLRDVIAAAALVATSSFGAQSIKLAWSPSASSDVTGYEIYYRTSSGSYSNVVSVGLTTNAIISGLIEGQTYFFKATSYSSNLNSESTPSNEISYTIPAQATLSIEVTHENDVVTSITVAVTESFPDQWVLESSADLLNWTAALRGTNTPVNFSKPVAGYPALFFRLKSVP